MRTLTSGIRGTTTGEHVARPVYSLAGVNLIGATESTCRTCGASIAKTGADDGLRGSWRHRSTPPVIAATDLLSEVHEAHDRNEARLLQEEVEAAQDKALTEMFANRQHDDEAYDVAWAGNRPGYYTVKVPAKALNAVINKH